MRNLLNKIFLLVCIFSLKLPGYALAVSQESYPFLTIPLHARALAMGNANTGLSNDLSAIYYNPAGLAELNLAGVSLSYKKLLQEQQIEFLDLAVACKLKGKGTFAVSFRKSLYTAKNWTEITSPEILGENQVDQWYIGLSIAQNVTRKIQLGGNIKIIQNNVLIGEFDETSHTFNLDFGIAIRALWPALTINRKTLNLNPFNNMLLRTAPEGISFGAVLKNIGPTVRFVESGRNEAQPMLLRLGCVYNIFDSNDFRVLLTSDIEKYLVSFNSEGQAEQFYKALINAWRDRAFIKELEEITYHFGTEVKIDYLASLRAGFLYDETGRFKTWTFGAGFGPETAQLNVTIIPVSFNKNYAPKNREFYFSFSAAF